MSRHLRNWKRIDFSEWETINFTQQGESIRNWNETISKGTINWRQIAIWIRWNHYKIIQKKDELSKFENKLYVKKGINDNSSKSNLNENVPIYIQLGTLKSIIQFLFKSW